MNKQIQTQGWYQALVDECRAIITERVYSSRQELIVGYGEVGERIYNDPKYQKHIHGNRKFVNQLFSDIGIGESTGYYCLQFYEKFIFEKHNEVSTAMETLFPDDGKNISWTKIKTKYLPEQKKEAILLPKGKYGVIYADPPWPYPAHLDIKKLYGVAQQHYNLMSIKDICDLKIGELAADSSVLFMWVATNFLEDSFKVINNWGFNYKSQMVWVKMPLTLPSVGYYVRSHHELLLIATKGSYLPKTSEYIKSVVEAPRLEHSQKPDIFYEIIEKMYPDDKYIELFARNKRNGWQSWGNEI